jgi:predicted N-acetyltransferase YhbS
VVGFYSLAVGAVARADAPGRIRRNMPDPLPVMVLARLAVDRRWKNRGIGKGLLRDAVLRTLQVAEMAGLRAMVVHALSDDAKHFYKAHGFAESPFDPMTLFLSLRDIQTRPA